MNWIFTGVSKISWYMNCLKSLLEIVKSLALLLHNHFEMIFPLKQMFKAGVHSQFPSRPCRMLCGTYLSLGLNMFLETHQLRQSFLKKFSSLLCFSCLPLTTDCIAQCCPRGTSTFVLCLWGFVHVHVRIWQRKWISSKKLQYDQFGMMHEYYIWKESVF